MRKTKAKNKTVKKTKASKKRMTPIKSKDGFIMHPGSPLSIQEIMNDADRRTYAQKKGGYIMEGVEIGSDPIDVSFAFQNLMLKAELDNRMFMAEYNPKTKTARYTSALGSDENGIASAYLRKLASDLKQQQTNSIRNLNGLGGTPEQVEGIKGAYNKAIMHLEEFLVNTGELQFSEKTCEYGNHQFEPSNSVVDICEPCEAEINS